MTKEKCWTCKKVKTGVKLRSTDDRMCEECFVKNENALKQLVSDNTQPGCSGGSLSSSGTGSALCQHCNVPANDTDSLLCDICVGTFHAKCAGITDDVFTALAQILTVTGWVCTSCRASSRKAFCQLQSGQTQLAEEVAVEELKTKVATLQATIHNMTSSAPIPRPQSGLATVMREANKRKKTVVVSSLQQVPGTDDATIFTNFCENHLALKPYVDLRQVKRVGKSVPQKLIVPLLSEHSAAEVLCRAKELCRATDPEVCRVYINPDLSREEAKAAYEKRLARRHARDAPILHPVSTSSLLTDQVFMDSRQSSSALAVGHMTLPIISSVPTGKSTAALDPDAPSFHT